MLFSENSYDTLLPMTSSNWYDQEPYCEIESHGTRDDEYFIERYNIPLIIEKAKEREKTTITDFVPDGVPNKYDMYCVKCKTSWGQFNGANFCPHCGREIVWS